jgi:hypothetical protein
LLINNQKNYKITAGANLVALHTTLTPNQISFLNYFYTDIPVLLLNPIVLEIVPRLNCNPSVAASGSYCGKIKELSYAANVYAQTSFLGSKNDSDIQFYMEFNMQ